MLRLLRRSGCVLALVVGACLVLVAAFPLLMPRFAGAWEREPTPLSPEAQALLDRCLEGVDPALRFDFHVHAVGIGTGGSGCWVNPRMRSLRHPIDRVRFEVYLHASGIDEMERADEQYVARLLTLIGDDPRAGRYGLLAFDHCYDEAGAVDLGHSEFHVPNDYVLGLAERYPELLEPVVSIHPYRRDAVAEVERCAQRGARLVKWLPNAMGIDPMSALCDAFYAKMAELDMTILTHGGEEKAVHAEERQSFGNPLRLRRALDAGVRVIVAHCASLGDNVDLDDLQRGRVSNFELFLRLMEDERYEGLLYGEISAATQLNRYRGVLDVLLDRQDLHARLVNGSDYPLPAINVLFSTRALMRDGFLTADERAALNEIYLRDPLLFDFALKRTVHHPQSGGRFAPRIFERPDEL